MCVKLFSLTSLAMLACTCAVGFADQCCIPTIQSTCLKTLAALVDLWTMGDL